MSSYKLKTKHPETGKWEEALWLDNFFGRRKYGVVFPSDKLPGNTTEDIAFDPRKVDLETKK